MVASFYFISGQSETTMDRGFIFVLGYIMSKILGAGNPEFQIADTYEPY